MVLLGSWQCSGMAPMTAIIPVEGYRPFRKDRIGRKRARVAL